MFFFVETLLTSLQPSLVEHCGVMNRTGLSQSFSLHSDSTSVPSIPPAISGSNKQHPAPLALHRQSTSIGSIRPSVRPSSLPSIHQAKTSQAKRSNRGGGWRGLLKHFTSPILEPPFCLQRRVLDEGLFDHHNATTFDSKGQQNKKVLSAAAWHGASLDSVGGLVVPDEELQQLVPPVESVSELAQLVGHFDGDLLL